MKHLLFPSILFSFCLVLAGCSGGSGGSSSSGGKKIQSSSYFFNSYQKVAVNVPNNFPDAYKLIPKSAGIELQFFDYRFSSGVRELATLSYNGNYLSGYGSERSDDYDGLNNSWFGSHIIDIAPSGSGTFYAPRVNDLGTGFDINIEIDEYDFASDADARTSAIDTTTILTINNSGGDLDISSYTPYSTDGLLGLWRMSNGNFVAVVFFRDLGKTNYGFPHMARVILLNSSLVVQNYHDIVATDYFPMPDYSGKLLLAESPDGSFYITAGTIQGVYYTCGAPPCDEPGMSIYKFNSLGNYVWSKSYNLSVGKNEDIIRIAVSPSGYLYGIYADSSYGSNYSFSSSWILNPSIFSLDANGNTRFWYTLSLDQHIPYDLAFDSNGALLVAGAIDSSYFGEEAFFIGRLEPNTLSFNDNYNVPPY